MLMHSSCIDPCNDDESDGRIRLCNRSYTICYLFVSKNLFKVDRAWCSGARVICLVHII